MRALILLCCALGASFAHASILDKCGPVFAPRRPTPHEVMAREWDEAARRPFVKAFRQALRQSEEFDPIQTVLSAFAQTPSGSAEDFFVTAQLLLQFPMIPGVHALVGDIQQFLFKLSLASQDYDLSLHQTKALLVVATKRIALPTPPLWIHLLRWGKSQIQIYHVHDSLDTTTATAETFLFHYETRLDLFHSAPLEPYKQFLLWIEVVKASFEDALAGGSKMTGSEFVKSIRLLVEDARSYHLMAYPIDSSASHKIKALTKTRQLGSVLRALSDSVEISHHDKFAIRGLLSDFARHTEGVTQYLKHPVRGVQFWIHEGMATLGMADDNERKALQAYWAKANVRLSDEIVGTIDYLMAPRWGSARP